MGHYEINTKRKVCITKCPHKVDKAHTSDLTAHLKALKQKGAESPSRSRRQKIIYLRSGMSNIEKKKAIQRINETKRWFFE